MLIEFTYQRDADYLEQLFSVQAEWAATMLYVAGSLVVLGGAALVAGFHAGVLDAAPGVGFLVLGAVLLRLGRWRLGRRSPVPAPLLAPRRWTITDRGVGSAGEQSTVHFDWTALRSMTELPKLFVFRHADGTRIDVPREPLTAEQEAELQARALQAR